MTQEIMKKKNITERLESGKILPLIIKLSVPAVIAQLITFLYNIVDRMYVARIKGAGTDALAALGIVLPITLIIQAFSSLIGTGGAPRAGIKTGEGNFKEAGCIFGVSASYDYRRDNRRRNVYLRKGNNFAVRLFAVGSWLRSFVLENLCRRYRVRNACAGT